MIVVHINKGNRLGNLLFDIGQAYTIQSKLENKPQIYCNNNILTNTDYFKNVIKPVFFNDVIFKDNVDVSRLKRIKGRTVVLADVPIEDNLYLYNHFQNCITLDIDLLSEKYAIPGAEEFVKNTYPEVFDCGKEVIGINVRRGDFLTFDNGKFFKINGLDFYKRALDEIGTEGKNVFIVSDDIEWCKNNFKGFGDNIYFSKGPEVINNLRELVMCDYMILGSSSTYSIWASYINKKKKLVLYPKKFYNDEGCNCHTDILFRFDNYKPIDN